MCVPPICSIDNTPMRTNAPKPGHELSLVDFTALLCADIDDDEYESSFQLLGKLPEFHVNGVVPRVWVVDMASLLYFCLHEAHGLWPIGHKHSGLKST